MCSQDYVLPLEKSKPLPFFAFQHDTDPFFRTQVDGRTKTRQARDGMRLAVENELSVEIAQMSSVAKRRIEEAKAALESKETMMKGIGSVTKNMELVMEVIGVVSEV